MIVFLFIIIFSIIIYYFFYKKKEHFNVNQYFYNNEYVKKKVNGKIFYDNCINLCNDNTFCRNFEQQKKNYNNCLECKKKGHCLKKLETNETICEPCIDGIKYINNCDSSFIDACPPKNNIYNFYGGKPYFVLISDDNIYNPYNTKCVPCKR